MKILVADDDLGSRLVAQAAVHALGHQCLVAVDGTEAWQLLQAERPDVLLSDRAMPGMDGLELCRQVRRLSDGYTYIVLLTGHGQPQDVLAGMRAGADDYLAKPLNPLDLQARLLAAQRVTDLHTELARVRADLARQAHTDPLTGLRNRLSLNTDLDGLHRSSARDGRTYAVALCDVDFFKRYNDTYGHLADDLALRTVAAALTSQLREGDRIYRYGGEEFLILLPEQDEAGAGKALNRVRQQLERCGVKHDAGGPTGVLTLSCGIAVAEPGSPTAGQVLADADAALYEAKAGGRDTVVSSRRRHLGGQEAVEAAPAACP